MDQRTQRARSRALDVFPEKSRGSTAASSRSIRFSTETAAPAGSVLNLILVRLGYPPAIIYKRQRAEYLRALQRADDGDAGLLGELLARAILDNLYRFVVPAVAGPARLVPLAALATEEIGCRRAPNRGDSGSSASHSWFRRPMA